EPEAYRKLRGPPRSYVGHPLIEQIDRLRPNAEEQARRNSSPPIVLLLPGSRRSEIAHHLGVFGAALDRLRSDGVTFDVMLPTMTHLEAAGLAGVANWAVVPTIVVGEAEKRAA